MAKVPASGASTRKEMDEYFEARNRELTRRAMARNRDPSAESPMKAKPVEFVELFSSDSIEKDYGGYKMSYENGRGFKRKGAGSKDWEPAGLDAIRVFKEDIKAAAAENPKISRYIADDPEFK